LDSIFIIVGSLNGTSHTLGYDDSPAVHVSSKVDSSMSHTGPYDDEYWMTNVGQHEMTKDTHKGDSAICQCMINFLL
jgi:hypothetical protein